LAIKVNVRFDHQSCTLRFPHILTLQLCDRRLVDGD